MACIPVNSSDVLVDINETDEAQISSSSNLENMDYEYSEEDNVLSYAGFTYDFVDDVMQVQSREPVSNSQQREPVSNSQHEALSSLLEMNSSNPNVVWIVEPSLDVEYIRYLSTRDTFVALIASNQEVDVDPLTGRLTGEERTNPGYPRNANFVYDPERNLFGEHWGNPSLELHPMSEFLTRFSNNANTINVFYSVDPSQGYSTGYAGNQWRSLGKGAVAFGSSFVTDFIYDVDCGGVGSQWIYGATPFTRGGNLNNPLVAAVSLGGRWGIVNQHGNTVVPHEFEHIVTIDNTSAFAKYNGRYGILRIPSGITVVLDGEQVQFDQSPIMQQGRTLVPLRAIFEALGADVIWNESSQTVTATRSGVAISLEIGSNVLVRNGEIISLDVPAQLIGGRTLVPARAVAESFGAAVSWDEATQMVRIASS